MATLVVRPNDPSDHSEHNAPRSAKRFCFRGITILLWTLRLASVVVLSWLAILEVRTSFLQSAIFSHLAGEMRFTVGPGPSHDIRFPHAGPKDERLGYAGLPSFIERLGQHHFVVERQATLSPRLDQFIRAGFYAVYPEKSHAGFSLLDRAGTPLYETSYPAWSYTNFQAIPPIIAKTLLFIEDRNLLDTLYPDHNPAVDWNRFLLAASGQALGWLDPGLKQGGASTLATQIEKFQHSPAGRTGGIGEKLRQMATASARAYLDGPDTTAARQRIVTTYLNATPLSSRPGDGEIIGVGNGLLVWYGTDFSEANRVLAATASTPTELARKAMLYKQVLSLLLAQRRPSYYLVVNRQALEALTERYLRVLCAAGLIDPPLRDAALAAELRFRAVPQELAPHSFTGSKAADAIRTELLTLLHAPNFYSLDRFDLTARSTIDAAGQERINGVLSRLGQPAYVKSLGLVGEKLLGSEDPSRVTYSVVLCERGADRNYVRIHADSLDEPVDKRQRETPAYSRKLTTCRADRRRYLTPNNTLPLLLPPRPLPMFLA